MINIQTNAETIKQLMLESGISKNERSEVGIRISVKNSCCGGVEFELSVDTIQLGDFYCETKYFKFIVEKAVCMKYGDLSVIHTALGYKISTLVPLKTKCGKRKNYSDIAVKYPL